MNKWIIEARNADGQLDFAQPQPEQFFGLGAIHGMTDDEIAKIIYRWSRDPAVVLDGRTIATWPSLVDARFIARRKTW